MQGPDLSIPPMLGTAVLKHNLPWCCPHCCWCCLQGLNWYTDTMTADGDGDAAHGFIAADAHVAAQQVGHLALSCQG
jgi:hypothetical protein